MEQDQVVTVSMRVMSAGDGYQYLLKTVAAGDGNRDLSTPLTRYYAEKGTPPGTAKRVRELLGRESDRPTLRLV